MTKPNPTPPLTYALVAAFTGLIGFGAVYATLKPADNQPAPVTAPVAKIKSTFEAPPSAPPANLSTLATGEMITFVFRKTPEAIPDFKFEDGTGAVKTLADWKGKVVLLNLWATWCAPCRKEMPALDRLQRELGSDKFEVVALSLDRAGAGPSKKFLDDIKVTNLKLYVESTSKSFTALRTTGLPTTILINADGLEVGRLTGPAEWDSADAKRLVQSLLK
jgi:thiol-disulfide isomerase/thioredoxin